MAIVGNWHIAKCCCAAKIDPITVLILAVIALVAGLAAFFDPKTYSRKSPT
jgi:hypothetical protein